ncbi:unnamed protein product, partial [marine sediment metagenome]
QNYGARFWKSEDSGVTWEDLTEELPASFFASFPANTPEDFTDDFAPWVGFNFFVEVAPDNADFVVVAGSDWPDWPDSYQGGSPDTAFVYGSNEGGEDFEDTEFPGTAGTDNLAILCLDVSCEVDDDDYNIAVGTGWNNGGQVYRFVAGGYWGGIWKDATTYDGWFEPPTAVHSVAFSPNFAADDTILAVTAWGHYHSNVGATYLQTGLWGDTEAWNEQAGDPFPAATQIVDAPPLHSAVRGMTGIALPDDFTGYDSDLRYSWVYVNYDARQSDAAVDAGI